MHVFHAPASPLTHACLPCACKPPNSWLVSQRLKLVRVIIKQQQLHVRKVVKSHAFGLVSDAVLEDATKKLDALSAEFHALKVRVGAPFALLGMLDFLGHGSLY